MARHKEFDKASVLEKALLLFWQKGYDATSVRDLIDVMGISSSSLYESFGDKRAIYIAALRIYCERERQDFRDLLKAAQHPKVALEMVFLNVKSHLEGSLQGLFSLNSIVEFGTRDAEITAILLEHYEAIWELFRDNLQAAQTQQDIANQGEMGDVANTILAALYGYVSILRIKPDFHGGDGILASLQSLLD